MHGARSIWVFIKGAKRMEWIVLVVVLAMLALVLTQGGIESGNDVVPTELEARMAQALSCIGGAGRVKVLIGEGDMAGVLVVAEGADDLRVALELARAVKTLLGVDNERIEVLTMERGGA